MITTVTMGISMIMVNGTALYFVIRGFDRILQKELPIQTLTFKNWLHKE